MFARATSGDRKNNNKFSPCSLRAIDPVLNNKARSPKGCFTGWKLRFILGYSSFAPGQVCEEINISWVHSCLSVGIYILYKGRFLPIVLSVLSRAFYHSNFTPQPNFTGASCGRQKSGTAVVAICGQRQYRHLEKNMCSPDNFSCTIISALCYVY